MDHLYSSRVEVLRLSMFDGGGYPVYRYTVVEGMESLPCRLDLNFVRPGKDQPMPAEAGRTPDRVGLMFCSTDSGIRSGDRLRAVSGPVEGMFEIRVVPDVAVDYSSGHHMEVQVVEVAQQPVDDFSVDTPFIP